MKIRISGVVNDSIVDGEGIRFTVFTQGCLRGCRGCHNPQTHDLLGGYEVEVDELISMMKKNPLLDGLTISGGEPFLQALACLELAQKAHKIGLNVWCYTGYTYEELIEKGYASALLNEIDVLVDGEFRLEERTLELPWRGSKNQRVINLNDVRKKDSF